MVAVVLECKAARYLVVVEEIACGWCNVADALLPVQRCRNRVSKSR